MKKPEVGDKVVVPEGPHGKGSGVGAVWIGTIFGFKSREGNERYPEWAKVRVEGNEVYCPNLSDMLWDEEKKIWTVKAC